MTLDGNVTADGLAFNTPGYEVTNTDGISVLTLAGTPIITIPGGDEEIDCIIAGSAGLTGSGSGFLTLGGTNTYTGAVSIGGSFSLILNGPNVFTGATTIGSFGSLTVGDSGSLAGGAYPGNIANGGGFITYNSSVAQTLSGIISGSGSLTQDGPGALTLSGLNTFTGGITINSNTLTISGSGDLGNNITFNTGGYAGTINDNGSFAYNSSAAQTLSGTIDGTGTLTQSGPGTLTLSGIGSYTGATFITSGTLAVGAAGYLGNTAVLSISPGAVFDVSAVPSPYSFDTGSLSANGTATAAATIKGASSGVVVLGSQPVSLTFTPQTFSGDTNHPALKISQGGLTANGNVVTVTNSGASPLGAGTYTLLKVAGGSLAGSATLAGVYGAGLAPGTAGSLSVDGGNLDLIVSVPPVPVINSVAFSGGNLVLSGTNGPASATYLCLDVHQSDRLDKHRDQCLRRVGQFQCDQCRQLEPELLHY